MTLSIVYFRSAASAIDLTICLRVSVLSRWMANRKISERMIMCNWLEQGEVGWGLEVTRCRLWPPAELTELPLIYTQQTRGSEQISKAAE